MLLSLRGLYESSGATTTAATFVGSTNTAGATSSSISLTQVTGVASGNLLLAFIVGYDSTGITITPPSGWTAAGTSFSYADGSGGNFDLVAQIFYKVATGSEPGSYSFSISGSDYTDAILVAYSGVGSTPIDGYATGSGSTGNTSGNRTIPAITTAGTNTTEIIFSGGYSSAISTGPTGFTSRATNDGSVNAAYDKVCSSSGSQASTTIAQGAPAGNSQSGYVSAAIGIAGVTSGGGGTTYNPSITGGAVLTGSATATDVPAGPKTWQPSVSGTVNASGTTGYTRLSWFYDDFSGGLSSEWIAMNRTGDTGNSELEWYLPSQLTTDASGAHITAVHTTTSGQPYTSAMIQLAHRNFIYGTLEFTATYPEGGGVWPAIWLLGYKLQQANVVDADASGYGGVQWPASGAGEIDVVEELNGNSLSSNMWYGTSSSPSSDQGTLSVGVNTQHTWKVVWAANNITWICDGTTVRTISSNSNVPNYPMFLIYNVAVGGTGGGTDTPSAYPLTATLQNIRISTTNGSSYDQGSATGGAVLSGSATAGIKHAAITWQPSVTGSATLTGTTNVHRITHGSASGTATLTGSANAIVQWKRGASGTATLTGSTNQIRIWSAQVAGASHLTGSTTVSATRRSSASGTATLSGTTHVGVLHHVGASGTASLTGSATATLHAGPITWQTGASGTVHLAGSTTAVRIAHPSVTGAATLTGSANIERIARFLPVSASGSANLTGSVNANVVSLRIVSAIGGGLLTGSVSHISRFGPRITGGATLTGSVRIIHTIRPSVQGTSIVLGTAVAELKGTWQGSATGGAVLSGSVRLIADRHMQPVSGGAVLSGSVTANVRIKVVESIKTTTELISMTFTTSTDKMTSTSTIVSIGPVTTTIDA